MEAKEPTLVDTPPANDSKKRNGELADESLPLKKSKSTPTLVMLKNTRLYLRQKAVGWDRTMPVLRAVLAFQSFIADNTSTVYTEVPHEHLGVIASLAQESDKNETELAKRIHATLFPEGSEIITASGEKIDMLSVTAIQTSLRAIATRVNYGVEATSEDAVPSLWRWEVQDSSLLPKENLDKLLSRREERVRAKAEAQALFETLPSEKQQSLLASKKPVRTQKQQIRQVEADTLADDVPSSSPPPVDESSQESPKRTTPPSREKTERTKLRETRRAERQAREEKEEKDKQAQVRLFNAFFQQPVSKPAKKDDTTHNKSDFELTFLPCEYKDMAEPNKFYHAVGDELLSELDSRTTSPSDLLAEFKNKYPTKRPAYRRGIHPHVCVRDIMKAVTESDVLGGNAEEQVKRGLEKLNNRKLVSIKLLQFHLERRPGWVGTHTRSSQFITPRKPLGQDPVSIDYTVDSDAEWEDVEEGDNVDDAMDDREDEAESMMGSDEDSEMADWLEDDLEEEDAPPMDEDLSVPDSVSMSRNALVRDSSAVHTLKPKKKLKLLGRRFDSKLVPYITGPHWETTLSVPSHESFAPFQVRMLNEAYVGLDPFTFVSTFSVVDCEKPADTQPVNVTAHSALSGSSDTLAPSSAPRTTKFLFPDTHMPELCSKIEGSTRSKTALIEDLWEYFAPTIKGLSKAAIEARLQECAVRESKKPGAKWLIKEENKVRDSSSVLDATSQNIDA